MKSSKFQAVVIISILLVGVLIQVLYDPIPSVRHSLLVSNIRIELPQARAKWESLGIDDYTFEIVGDARSICKPSAIIEVRNDKVIKVETKDFASADAPVQLLPLDQWADPDWGEEVFLCNYYHFTMPQIFDLIEITLQNYPSSIMEADFDSQYGFVSDLNFGIYVGYGLARPKLDNCCNEFQIRNFQAVITP